MNAPKSVEALSGPVSGMDTSSVAGVPSSQEGSDDVGGTPLEKELVEALRPFARFWSDLEGLQLITGGTMPSDHKCVATVAHAGVGARIELGSFRKARAAIAKAEATATEAQHAGQWRPIESAPRDGTHVILAFGSDGVMEGWWEDADPGAYPWKFVDRGCFTKSPFTAGEYLNGAREVRGGPTRWQPLPTPPSPAPPSSEREGSRAGDRYLDAEGKAP